MRFLTALAQPTVREWIGFILGLAAIWIGITGGLKALRKGARQSLPKEEPIAEPEEALPSTEEWNDLVVRAGRAVDDVIAQLPGDVAAEARQVPCLFHEWGKTSNGYRTLGNYHNFIPGRVSDRRGPIVLFLRTIQECAAERNADFAEIVKTTYMHELGHHLGWDEVDLARVGLPSGRPPGK